MNVVLLRVGIDSGCGGIQGPLFDDGSFEFIWMPDRTQADSRTYGNTIGQRSGKALIEFFPLRLRAAMAGQAIHVDPEFETYSYGDPTTPKAGLRRLKAGDLLVFYAGLRGSDHQCRPALYLVGYFEVSLAGRADDLGDEVVRLEFAANFHVRHPAVYERDKGRLLLIKGGPGSRLLGKARAISSVGEDRNGVPLKVLSPDLRGVFGDFGGLNSIQRSAPRWVSPSHVSVAAEFVRSLP